MGRSLRLQRVMDLKQLEYFVSVVDLGGFTPRRPGARRRPAGHQPAGPQSRGGTEAIAAVAQRPRRHAHRGRQAPARARTGHPAAGRACAPRRRRDQGRVAGQGRHRPAADRRPAVRRADRARVPAALPRRFAQHRRGILVDDRRVAGGGSRRRGACLQSGPGRRIRSPRAARGTAVPDRPAEPMRASRAGCALPTCRVLR